MEVIEGQFEDQHHDLMTNLSPSLDTLRAVFPMVVEKMKKEANFIRYGFLVGGILTICFLVVVTLFLSSLIISPVVAISEKAMEMANGDLPADSEIKCKGMDEIGKMTQSFEPNDR